MFDLERFVFIKEIDFVVKFIQGKEIFEVYVSLIKLIINKFLEDFEVDFFLSFILF